MNLESIIQFAVDNGALDDENLREAIEAFYTTPPQLKEPEQRSVSEHLEPVAWMFEFPDKRLAPKFDSAPHGGNWQPLYKGKNT